MKNSLLSSRAVDNTINDRKLENEAITEIVTNKAVTDDPTNNDEDRDVLIVKLFKELQHSLLKNHVNEETTVTEASDHKKVLNQEENQLMYNKENNDALIRRLFKQSILSSPKHHSVLDTSTTSNNYDKAISDQESLLSSFKEHTTSRETYKENNDHYRRRSNDYDNTYRQMKSLFENIITQKKQQDDSSTTKQVHKDIPFADKLYNRRTVSDVVASKYGDSLKHSKKNSDKRDLTNSDNTNHQNFVNHDDISPTSAIENLRRLKNDLNKLYKLVIKERKLKHAE